MIIHRKAAMTPPKIRKCDRGTEYAAELTAGSRAGPAHATDAQLMAMFCESIMPFMVGAFSPRLVWEGAQRRGMTALQLHNVCAEKDFATLDDLQFGD
jgi:hypothetical protein